ncbi:hypothetical protein [Propionispora hippei]|uniref:Lipoprotein n=1 Tax=Propionispora hippei DSM 15287 TaxID=1123003 RepID=A0A1M6AD18_9FIRM|nr:hypothetical protein [Propionispora hippei]SHI34434.1 hypothetical protein SAMN02745170_00119 [Propionispora hippei DSM 15287]
MTKNTILMTVITVFLLCALSGCSMLQPAPKPEIGPAGKPLDSLPNPPFNQRFVPPPAELYDLAATAGVIFEGVNKKNWQQAKEGLNNLSTTWEKVQPAIGAKKGVKEANAALGQLTTAIDEETQEQAYETLNKFMGSISDIGKSYKLSPLADIIAVDNAIRSVCFYVEDQDWSKAASKVKALEGTWGQVKTSMESVGILDEIVKGHSAVTQMKDAVNGENKGAFDEQVANINYSMGRIRDFYRGK